MNEPTLDTTTPPRQPVSTQKPDARNFEDAMRVQLQKARVSVGLAAIAPLVLLPLGCGASALLGLLPSPLGAVLSIVLAAAAVGGVVLGVVIGYRTGPVKNVDWDTATAYERRLTEPLAHDVRVVLAEAQHRVRRRTPHAFGAHLYVMRPDPSHREESCTIDAGGCVCAPYRLSAALLPSRRHPVLVIGERLLTVPHTLLAFVLAHETHHARRASRTLHLLLDLPSLACWLALGLLVPPPLLLIAVPALWLVTTAARWGDELRADVAAVRAVGPAAARDYWAVVQDARPSRVGVSKVLSAIARPLAPHPPFSLRVALAARITGPRP
ncbi:hypothetical protein [Actinomadura sp. 3N508]|uniref:hypothetical protein n=1 Tax=Actinomadura sp. 3N508 TaxID=3375153 RepID=UPI0037A5A4ED